MSGESRHPRRMSLLHVGGAGVTLLTPAVALAQDAPDLTKLAELIRWGGVVASIPVIIGAFFAIRLIDSVGDRLSERFTNRRPTIQKVQTTVRFFMYAVTVAIAVSLSMRLDSTALTVIGGAMAFAVGFALRDVVASFIAGITIMFDRPFQVGDRVSYGGEYGDIIKIGLRSVRMRTLSHNIITIPNNKIFTDVTASGNYGALEMQVPMDFYISARQDPKVASEIVREACLTSPYVFLERPVPVSFKQVLVVERLAIQLRVRPYVFDTKYESSFEADVHARVLEAFRQRGIDPSI